MPFDISDTIVAVATPAGGAARGIVRVSGPQTVESVSQLFSSSTDPSWKNRSRANRIHGELNIGTADNALRLPAALLLWPGTCSYTRQPVAEIHTLGSPPLIDALVEAICQTGARLAEPGEFTLRAFLAGRIDLPQAEAVIGVVDAQTSEQYQTALGQLAGGMSQPLNQLREQLLQLLAELEAGLDFVEEDITFITSAELASRFQSALETVESLRKQMTNRTEFAPTSTVVLWGPPNAGKSSLFNAMLQKFGSFPDGNSAIVSEQSGTTRDFLTAEIDLEGVRCQLVDTAGADDTMPADTLREISTAAQRHTAEQSKHATLKIICSDTISTLAINDNGEQNVIRVLTKCDLQRGNSEPPYPTNHFVNTSSQSGMGLERLANLLRAKLLAEMVPTDSNVVATTAVRCQESLRLAAESLRSALYLAESEMGDELIASEARTALNELGQVVGAVYTDDILDRVFSTFCIGK